jgi:ABC-type multidrug transport system permease subunit
MLAAFRKDLRLLLADRSALFLTLVAPLVMITIITLARRDSAEPYRPTLIVVDEDNGPVAAAFIELLGKHADVVTTDATSAEHMVRDLNRAPAAIVFPRGLSKRYLQEIPSEVRLLTDPAQAVGLDSIRALLLVMDRDAAELADPLHEDLLVYREEHLTGRELSPKSIEQNIPGFTIMFVLLAVVLSAAWTMHDERNWGTLTRLLVAPRGFAPLLAGKLGARVVIGFVQTLLLLVWGRVVFGSSLGTSPTALVLLSAALAFAAAALGMLVAALASSREQTLPIGLGITIGLAALCGLWWPLGIVPSYLRTIGQCFFPTWAMYGMTDIILRDRGIESLMLPLGIVVAQGIVILAVSLSVFHRRRLAA